MSEDSDDFALSPETLLNLSILGSGKTRLRDNRKNIDFFKNNLNLLNQPNKTSEALLRKTRVCQTCGEYFIEGSLSKKQRLAGHKAKFCSNYCAGRIRQIYEGETQEERKKHRARLIAIKKGFLNSDGLCNCKNCNILFLPRHLNERFCSETCRFNYNSNYNRENYGKDYYKNKYWPNGKPKDIICKECQNPFSPEYGDKKRIFCSKKCLQRFNSRIGKYVREFRKRGGNYEEVNIFLVFNRDNWTCGICGIPTPKELRGTYHDSAPELDHIIPLALGGDHSYNNTQCACRKCNGEKGATHPDLYCFPPIPKELKITTYPPEILFLPFETVDP